MSEIHIAEEKKHSACDECRTRKLKCSGGLPACQRCQSEVIECIYSPRKKMGRPRKRRREDEEPEIFDFNDAEIQNFEIDPTMPSYYDLSGPSHPLETTPNLLGSGFESLDPALMGMNLMPGDPTLQSQNRELDQMLEDNLHFPSTTIQSNSHSGQHSYPTPPGAIADVQPQGDICLCLSNMYLTLSNLSTIPEFQFPWHIHTLKAALRTSTSVLDCPLCPLKPTTAMQNIMMLTTLLTTIVECYRKLLNYIDQETTRATEAGETMQYRIGDSNPEKWHLHTGTLDCPMGFNLDLEPLEWKMLATKVIKADVHGNNTGQHSVLGLVGKLEERQHRWHGSEQTAEMRAHFSSGGRECRPEDGDHTCLKLVGMIRNHVDLLNL